MVWTAAASADQARRVHGHHRNVSRRTPRCRRSGCWTKYVRRAIPGGIRSSRRWRRLRPTPPSRSSGSKRPPGIKSKSTLRSFDFRGVSGTRSLWSSGIRACSGVGLSEPGHGHALRRAGGRVPLLRRCPAGAALRSNEDSHHARPEAGRRCADAQCRVSPLRAALGVSATGLSAVPRANQGQGRAARAVCARQFRVRPDVPARCRPRCAVCPVARSRGQCPPACHHGRAAAGSL